MVYRGFLLVIFGLGGGAAQGFTQHAERMQIAMDKCSDIEDRAALDICHKATRSGYLSGTLFATMEGKQGESPNETAQALEKCESDLDRATYVAMSCAGQSSFSASKVQHCIAEAREMIFMPHMQQAMYSRLTDCMLLVN